MAPVSEQLFQELLQARLGDHWNRALMTFRDWGPNLSFDVADVLLHASKQEKVPEVLSMLETHAREHLDYQHPEIRGRVESLGSNPTKRLLLDNCTGILGLKPNQE